MYKDIIDFIKSLYPNQNPVPLHAPVFLGKEKEYLLDCIDSTFVSYVGKYVTQFEDTTAKYTGSKYAVAVVNGTVALQIALQCAGVKRDDEVITQPLTFVATANAISHCGAKPVFVDVDLDSMGMSPEKLEDWLKKNTKYNASIKKTINQSTNKPISAIVPMHTFGFPCRIDEIIEIGNRYNIAVIEDSAESLGSFYKGKHTGTFGLAGIISYNGNKTITSGGGGMILSNDEEFAKKVKHITTTAKVPHKWEYIHDEVGYNYRLTNVNAAIGVGQMENLKSITDNKRETAEKYIQYFHNRQIIKKSTNCFLIRFLTEPKNSISNYWLNCIQFDSRQDRNLFLVESNSSGVMTRPIWRLMNELDIYVNCQTGNLNNSKLLYESTVNIPSGYRK